MTTVNSKDCLKGFTKEKEPTFTLAEYNKLLQRIDQLENTVKALQLTNRDLAEAFSGIKPKPTPPKKERRISFIE